MTNSRIEKTKITSTIKKTFLFFLRIMLNYQIIESMIAVAAYFSAISALISHPHFVPPTMTVLAAITIRKDM